MRFARRNDILGIETDHGKWIGFHARNLEVAHLSEFAYRALESRSTDEHSEERAELEIWNSETNLETVDADASTVLSARVRSLMVNVAQVCNLKCVYCAAGGDGTFGEKMQNVEIDAIYKQIDRVLRDLSAGDTFSLTFFGGEPLLAPETIRKLARFVKLETLGREINVKFRVITNATLVTPEIAEYLATIGCHVVVSLDGPPEVNDLNRRSVGGHGSTLRTLRGIEELKRVRERLGSLTVNAVFGRHNIDVLSSYQYLSSIGFDSINFDFAAEVGDESISQSYQESLAATADFAFARGGEVELRQIEAFDAFFKALDQRRRLNNHCGAGKTHLAIDGKGRASVCQCFLGTKSESLGLADQIDQEKLNAFQTRLNLLNDCGACWARHLCGGGCMFVNQLKNGTKHKKDGSFCDRTRTTIAKAIEIYAEARFQDSRISPGDDCETY